MIMAENVLAKDAQLVQNIKALLWGSTIEEEIFRQWAQGFFFSIDEPTALVQTEGGPCAVIAPVQAFILKQLLMENDISAWKDIKSEKCNQLLVQAMTEVVSQATDTQNEKYSLLLPSDCNASIVSEQTLNSESLEPMKYSEFNTENSESVSNDVKTLISHSDNFHSQLSKIFIEAYYRIYTTDNINDVQKFFTEHIDALKDQYGILLLLYTVVCTKGIAAITSEMSDPTEPMIDSTYGYGSQSLINLMLTGQAVSHVWDHDQDIGGLKLRGIEKQNSIGFLALLEHLRYCEVGTFLKSPSHPIWVLGSETHLTVLFSTERRLVSPETPSEQARRVFKRFDPEGNNFIPSNSLQNVLAELGLVADTEYVAIMQRKLDNENLGIILLASFMDEFFPEETCTCPDTFPLYHYNGLPRSNPEKKVKYHKGQAVLLECTVKCILDSDPMLTVLQTKWPRIEIQWDIGKNPSLN